MKILNKLAWVLSLGFLIIGGAGSVSPSEGISKQSAFDENGRLKGPYDLYASKAAFEAAKKADDRILVQTHDELDEKVLASLGFASLESLGGENGWSLAHLQNENASTAVEKARKSGLFQNVDYDYEYQSDAVDYEPIAGNPSKDDEYWLNQCGIVDAWKYMAANGGTAGGTSNTVVAVIDTGVDYNHEDLKANMWVNTKEIPNNGIDDDKNGYVDDYYGANCVANNGNPMDDMGHGTHVAGLIAGANNSLGMVGVAYNCKIMAIKAGNSSGYFLNSDIVKALNYAYSMGADVINMSFGGTATTAAVESALETAYSRATLVAAAGNDGLPNEFKAGLPYPPEAMYPASYSFVLGVMSETQSGYESNFSNLDAYPDNSIEYDLYAPGEQMVSCLPNNKYAKWSGTSMATPVVSGVAALLRSQYKDRDLYSTKYLMSQITKASSETVNCIHSVSHNMACGLNAKDSFTKIPKPEVSKYRYYTLDSINSSNANNGNGIIEAGETVYLGLELQNKGGLAENTSVTIDVNREGGVIDSYVSITTPTIAFGSIGTYTVADNGLTRDANNNVARISNPLSVKIAGDCPNEYLCKINLSLSWENGLDSTDTTIYSKKDVIEISVHRGTILASTISTDTELKADSLYIISNNVIVAEGVTLTIDPGVKIQWYADSSSYYQADVSDMNSIKLLVKGNVIANGTLDKPIFFSVSSAYCRHNAYIQLFPETSSTGVFQNCDFTNLYFNSSSTLNSVTMDHCHFSKEYGALYTIIAKSVTNSRFDMGDNAGHLYNGATFETFDNNVVYWSTGAYTTTEYGALHVSTSFKNNVIFSTLRNGDNGSTMVPVYFGTPTTLCSISNNAFLPTPSLSSLAKWTYLFAPYLGGTYNGTKITKQTMNNTYWGGTPSTVIPALIHDYSDDATSAELDYTTNPYVEGNDLSSLWPFVKNIVLEDSDGNVLSSIGSGSAKVVVDFNRDMDTAVSLNVCFGSTEPFCDYSVPGAFLTKRQWVGNYNFKSAIENGQQYWSVYNGRADNDHFKELMVDRKRMGFTIDTTSAQSMALNAVSDATGVALSWTQDDYATLAGYNMYRSTTKEGTYTKINPVLIPFDVVAYKDTGVLPGKTYFYYFTVVLTDFTESLPSGATSVTTYDSQAPSLYHTAVTEAYAGSNLVITATITDNVGITSATLYYRVKGTTDWQSTSMTHLNSAYSGIIDASYITSAGLEYYISATDGINVVTSGTPEAPHFVTYKSGVTQNQKGDVDGDGMITVKDALMVLKSINGDLTLTTDQTTRGDVDNDGTLTAADALAILQYANGTITSF